MGKKKATEYNDFLDGEKLNDNAEIRTSLQNTSSTREAISPPPTRSAHKDDVRSKNNTTKKPQLTHFLCLPLTTFETRTQLESSLSNFKFHLSETGTVPIKAVRPIGTLHLTLGVMSLDQATLNAAIQHLQSLPLHNLLRDISQTNLAQAAAENGTICENLNAAGLSLPSSDSLTIDLKGLVAMQSPAKTSILYAKPEDETGRLYSFAKKLKEGFEEEGFMVREDRALKLHGTIVNTIYAKEKKGVRGSRGVGKTINDAADAGVGDDGVEAEPHEGKEMSRSEGHGPDAKSWMRFDARELIAKYADFVWAENVCIDRVQICKMGAKKVWSSGVEGQGDVVDEKYEVVFEKMISE